MQQDRLAGHPLGQRNLEAEGLAPDGAVLASRRQGNRRLGQRAGLRRSPRDELAFHLALTMGDREARADLLQPRIAGAVHRDQRDRRPPVGLERALRKEATQTVGVRDVRGHVEHQPHMVEARSCSQPYRGSRALGLGGEVALRMLLRELSQTREITGEAAS